MILIISCILVLGLYIILKNCFKTPNSLLEKSEFYFEEGISVANLEMVKQEKKYVITFDLKNTNNIQFNCDDYIVYFLDTQNNLLLKFSGNTLGNFDDSNSIRITYDIAFDISNLDKVIVAKKRILIL